MSACTSDHGCHQRCRQHNRIQVSSHMPSMPFCAGPYHGPQGAKQHRCNRASCTASVKVLSTLQRLDSKLSERFLFCARPHLYQDSCSPAPWQGRLSSNQRWQRQTFPSLPRAVQLLWPGLPWLLPGRQRLDGVPKASSASVCSWEMPIGRQRRWLLGGVHWTPAGHVEGGPVQLRPLLDRKDLQSGWPHRHRSSPARRTWLSAPLQTTAAGEGRGTTPSLLLRDNRRAVSGQQRLPRSRRTDAPWPS